MGIRRPCSCRCAIILVSLAIGVILLIILLRSGSEIAAGGAVNTTYAGAVLTNLCSSYNDGQISGDLCNRLCYFENLTLLEFYTENKIVAVLLIAGQKLVIKTQRDFYTQFDQLPATLPEKEFYDKVVEVVNYYLELDWPRSRIRHLLELIWPVFKRTNSLNEADRRSLWTLINQEEYLIYSVFQLANVFPKVTGSCGHFYAVEQLVPFKLDTVLYSNVKSKVLLHLMGTLKLLVDFLNEPLHWCDVKFENLGLSANYPKRFMVMDADMIYTDSRMQSLLNKTPCKKDDDCTFFDCTASCQHETGFCGNRTNDSVDIFCKKLVLQLFGPFWSKANKFLSACHVTNVSPAQRLKELRQAWAWTLADV